MLFVNPHQAYWNHQGDLGLMTHNSEANAYTYQSFTTPNFSFTHNMVAGESWPRPDMMTQHY
jgi:hypothetical protein